MLFSVIIPCKNEGKNIKMTIDSILTNSCKVSKEIIVVDDASNDNCCHFLKNKEYRQISFYTTSGLGAAQARNYGAGLAKGEILVFCDAHIKVEAFWLQKLAEDIIKGDVKAVSPAIAVLERVDQIGFGQTWDSELKIKWLINKPSSTTQVPLLPGGCMAIAQSAFEEVGGFDKGFKVWGHEDEEISLKLWLFNHPCAVNPAVTVEHLFRPKHPYRVLMYHVHYNLLRMAYSHFKMERVEKVKEKIKGIAYYEKLLKELLESDVMKQRKIYFSSRTHDDDWFMCKFGINF
ncbi:MAG: hypothetical protein PWQ96_1830 [Clostridia bacterium]|jgi:glycosyltransferase involved in cell wall biosynthesis|nr:hypothetical protein [Clostridiales bacterium]MDK2986186.1 hypothetical protein [Clostridia bacterium]